MHSFSEYKKNKNFSKKKLFLGEKEKSVYESEKTIRNISFYSIFRFCPTIFLFREWFGDPKQLKCYICIVVVVSQW